MTCSIKPGHAKKVAWRPADGNSSLSPATTGEIRGSPRKPRRMHTTMADAPAVNDQQVLAFLATAHKALSLREIAAAMGIRHSGRRALAKIIPRLERRGEIVQIRNGRFRLAEDRGSQKPSKDRPGSRDRAQRPTSEAVRSAQSSEAVRPAPSGHVNPSNVVEGRLVAHRDGY